MPFKKLLSLALALLLCLALLPMTIFAATSDSPSAWAASTVENAIVRGLIPKSLQQNYTSTVLRGDVAQMFINLIEKSSGQTIDAFLADKGALINKDVFADTTDKAVLAANALGIINGVGNNKFDPSGTFTRAQVAAIINRVARVLGVETGGYNHSFTDVNGHWVDAELGWTVHAGVLNGVGDNKFDPDGQLTTEQAIAITYRALQYLNNEGVEPQELTPGEHNISGFDELTNRMLSFCGIDFSFPSYFDVQSDDSTEIYKLYYPEKKDYYATLLFQCNDLSTTQEDFDSIYLPSIVNSIRVDMESDAKSRNEIIEYSKSEKATIAGMSGWIFTFSLKDNDKDIPSPGSLAFFYNINTEKVISILCGYESKDQSNHDYLGDYEKILSTAKLFSNTSSNNTTITKTDTGGWRQFLKDYEAFVDDYIAFMKKYQANPTDMTLLSDYADMMTRVSEWSENADEFSDELNDPSELAEYAKEYVRILTKMTTSLAE